jgi:hypothetical protein
VGYKRDRKPISESLRHGEVVEAYQHTAGSVAQPSANDS